MLVVWNGIADGQHRVDFKGSVNQEHLFVLEYHPLHLFRAHSRFFSNCLKTCFVAQIVKRMHHPPYVMEFLRTWTGRRIVRAWFMIALSIFSLIHQVA